MSTHRDVSMPNRVQVIIGTDEIQNGLGSFKSVIDEASEVLEIHLYEPYGLCLAQVEPFKQAMVSLENSMMQ